MTRSALVRATAVSLVVLIGAAAWIAGARHRFFDYDEIYHAHAAWLIAHGQRPFHDFLGSHSPFLWYVMAGLWRIFPETPSTLVPLRFAAAAGSLLSVIAVAICIAAVRRELSVTWIVAGIAAVAFDRRVLDYAVELRPDGWAAAMLFGAFALLLTRRPAALLLRCGIFSALATAAVIASPKLVLLPLIFGAVDVVERIRNRERPGGVLGAYVCGAGIASLLAWLFLRIAGIDPSLAFDLAIAYQWTFARQSAFGHGLFRSVLAQPLLLSLIIVGMLSWVGYLFVARRRPSSYEIALLLFLGAQLLVIDRPYKQYGAPWLLIGASFVPSVVLAATRIVPRAAPWCLAAAVGIGGAGAWRAWVVWSAQDQAASMLAFYDAVVRVSAADAPIVAFPPFHPVIRRDVFYGWSRTTDPAGHGTEAVMRDLAIPGYSQRFTREYYREVLNAKAPVLVVWPIAGEEAYEPAQFDAVREYLASHQQQYARMDGSPMRPVWVRQDR